MCNRKAIVGVVMLLLLMTVTVRAQTVDEIVNKYVAATGGAEKWKALETLAVVSRSEAWSFDLYWKKPNRVKVEVLIQFPGESGERGLDIRSFDGTTGWRLSPVLEGSDKPRLLSQHEVLDLLEEGDVSMMLINYKAKGYKIELMGKETSAYRLKITKPSGMVIDILIDDKTFLEVKQIVYARAPDDPEGPKRAIVADIGDYRAVNGLLLPHRIGASVREYRVNIPMDDNGFKMPGKENQDQESSEAKLKSKQSDTERARDPERRAELLKSNPEADVNKDGVLSLEEAWAFLKKDQAAQKLLPIGGAAPEWVLKDPNDKSHRLSDYKGKVVLMDFWAVWCIPCHRAMPWLEKVHTDLSKRGVIVVGISTGEKGGDPAQLMKDRGYSYGLMLHGETIAEAYAIVGLPTMYVIGVDGRIIYSGFGSNKILEDRRRTFIEEYLKQQGM